AVQLVRRAQAGSDDPRHVAEERRRDVGAFALHLCEALPRKNQEFAGLGGTRRGAAAGAVDEAHLADHVAGPERSERPVDVAADVLEDVYPAALDDEERVAGIVFPEQLLAADEIALLAGVEDHVGILGRELGEQAPAVQLAFVGHASCIAWTPRGPQVIRRAARDLRRWRDVWARGADISPRGGRRRRSARAARGGARASGLAPSKRACPQGTCRSPPAASARTLRRAARLRSGRRRPLPATPRAASAASRDGHGPRRSACASAPSCR